MAMRVISPLHVLLTSGTVVRFNNVGITGEALYCTALHCTVLRCFICYTTIL
jgi:hypothetical protein